MIIEEFEAKHKPKSDNLQTASTNKINGIEQATQESNSQKEKSNPHELKNE